MNFPHVHTNFWDAVIAVPIIMVMTQILKVSFSIKKLYVPTISLLIGLFISIFISHPHNIYSGLFMGFFYGYGAIGSYSSLKTTIIYFRKDNKHYS